MAENDKSIPVQYNIPDNLPDLRGEKEMRRPC